MKKKHHNSPYIICYSDSSIWKAKKIFDGALAQKIPKIT